MVTERGIQAFIHELEEGGWARWIRLALLVTLFAGLGSYLVFFKFRGLSSMTGIDQAQVAREWSRGKGFTTKDIRPLAVWQITKNKGGFPSGPIPDTVNAPLNPLINGIAFWLAGGDWDMGQSSAVFWADRMVASIALLFFGLAAVVSFFTFRRLFDHNLSLLAVGLMLVCSRFWEYALAGLPQMLMLLIFSGCLYVMVRAVDAHYSGRPAILWLAIAGFLFGLLALTQPLTAWIFVGAFIFSLMLFRPHGRDPLLMLFVFLIVVAPWLMRNYQVCGNPFGTAIYSVFYQIKGDLSGVMRSTHLDLLEAAPNYLRNKLQNQVLAQLGSLYDNLGKVIAAPVFFLALMHLFRRRETGMFRWAVLLMWAMGLVGMGLFGLGALGDAGNDLWILFIPVMTAYGLAFLLVLWNRLSINLPLARVSFLVFLYLVTCVPLVLFAVGRPATPVQWPPYVPPYISIMNNWIGDDEIIASDLPWGVAWYADRRSVWLPLSPEQLIDWNDYGILHSPIVAIYLTPMSGDERLFSDILKGEWEPWAAFILRTPNIVEKSPFKAVLPLPIDNQCVLFADRPRWEKTSEQ